MSKYIPGSRYTRLNVVCLMGLNLEMVLVLLRIMSINFQIHRSSR